MSIISFMHINKCPNKLRFRCPNANVMGVRMSPFFAEGHICGKLQFFVYIFENIRSNISGKINS